MVDLAKWQHTTARAARVALVAPGFRREVMTIRMVSARMTGKGEAGRNVV